MRVAAAEEPRYATPVVVRGGPCARPPLPARGPAGDHKGRPYEHNARATPQVPSSIEIVLLDHPEQLTQSPDTPAWGAGEPTIGTIPPAIANAIFNAIGKRLTVLPITKQRVLSA